MSLYDTAQLSSLGSTFQQELEERKMSALYPHSDRDLNWESPDASKSPRGLDQTTEKWANVI